MKNILILYASREGQTKKVATRICHRLENAGAKVQLINARDRAALEAIDLGVFDQLVFGASMHAGGLEKEIVSFINGHREAIEPRERSFFLVLLSAATKDANLRDASLQDARKKMAEQLLMTFEDIEMIAGALMYSKYSLPIKWIMKRIAKKSGEATDTSQDYEYTDWNQVEQYAKRLAETYPESADI